MIILNIKYMREVFLLCSCLILITMISAEDRYLQYKVIQNVQFYTKVAYSLDKTKLIFYSELTNKIDIYRAYDYTLLRPSDTTSLTSAPTALSYFQKKKGQNDIIYGNKNNEIMIYSESENDETIVFSLPSKIIKIEVSPNNINFAAVCQGDTKVYSGSIQMEKQMVKKVLFDFETTISSIKWRPMSNSLAIVGGKNGESKNKVLIYDIDTQKIANLSNDIKSVCQDIQFSADGLKIAYIQRNQGNYRQQIVKIMDLVTKQQTVLIATEANNLLQLKRYGNFLTAHDSVNSYVWKFDSINLGKKSSSLRSAGISPDGQDLISLSLNGKQLIIWTLCTDITTYYSQADDICAFCSVPCKSCFFSSIQCTSCIDQFYYEPKVFSCSACLNFCKTCKDEKTCENCLDKYYNEENVCKLCETSIQGCLKCSNGEICQTCDINHNWILNADRKCSCNNKFIKIGRECLACPSHCWKCQTVNTCNICDVTEHRKIQPIHGQCRCEISYYQSKQQKCELCMIGCTNCNQKDVCQQCDLNQYWVLNNQSCVCTEAFIQKDLYCIACSSLIEGCTKCDTFTTCTSCSSNYILNTSSKICDKTITETNILVVILVGAAILSGMGVGAYFLFKIIKKKRESKVVQTLLENTQQNTEINEKQ